MKKIRFFIIGILLPVLNASAQSLGPVVPLSIGDTVPATAVAHLPAFPGKCILLDFWASWCGSCSQELERLEEVQRKSNGYLQVILVAYEPDSVVQRFMQRRNRGPVVYIAGDTLLRTLFPYKMLPHGVLLDPKRQVVAIPRVGALNEQHVEQAFRGEAIRLPVKQDVFDFDRNRGLLQNGNGGSDTNLVMRSLLTGYLEGLFSGSGIEYARDSSVLRLYLLNRPVLGMYEAGLPGVSRSRLLLEGLDTTHFIRPLPSNGDWERANAYSYELTVDGTKSRTELGSLLLADLDRLFGIQSRWEQRKVPVWVISGVGRSDAREAADAKKLDYWVQVLNTRPGPVTLSEISRRGSLKVMLTKAELATASTLRLALRRYGLQLTVESRTLWMYVLRPAALRIEPSLEDIHTTHGTNGIIP